MRPMDTDSVELPLTFDVTSGITPLTDRRIKLGFFIVIAICVGALILGIISGSVTIFIACVVAAFIAITIFRLVYFNEMYYKKKYAELKTKGFVYDNNLIWDIYEISPGFPVCSFKNGSKAVFVTFDKDIIVGKPDNNEFLHYEAIGEAFNVLSKKNIECMHIDYMDTVGKDERLGPVIKQLLKTPNADLRQLLSVVFDYQQYAMSKSYSSYDVFAFYYKYSDDEFKDDLETLISAFMGANYIRYRLLGIGQMRELVKSIYNLTEFSVYNACDSVFRGQGDSNFIKVISTELDGITTVINRTSAEIAQARQENARRNSAALAAKQRKKGGADDLEEDVDLFGSVDAVLEEDIPQDDSFAYLDESDILGDFASTSPDLFSGHYAHESTYQEAFEEYDEEDAIYTDAYNNAQSQQQQPYMQAQQSYMQPQHQYPQPQSQQFVRQQPAPQQRPMQQAPQQRPMQPTPQQGQTQFQRQPIPPMQQTQNQPMQQQFTQRPIQRNNQPMQPIGNQGGMQIRSNQPPMQQAMPQQQNMVNSIDTEEEIDLFGTDFNSEEEIDLFGDEN